MVPVDWVHKDVWRRQDEPKTLLRWPGAHVRWGRLCRIQLLSGLSGNFLKLGILEAISVAEICVKFDLLYYPVLNLNYHRGLRGTAPIVYLLSLGQIIKGWRNSLTISHMKQRPHSNLIQLRRHNQICNFLFGLFSSSASKLRKDWQRNAVTFEAALLCGSKTCQTIQGSWKHPKVE